MIIHLHDEQGYFMGFRELPDDTPRPRNATTTPPPGDPPAGQVWRWIGEWVAVTPPGAETSSRVLSRIQFRMLFSESERGAVDGYATNPALTEEQRSKLRVIVNDFAAADTIDLSSPLVREWLEYLESIGLLEAGRTNTILGG